MTTEDRGLGVPPTGRRRRAHAAPAGRILAAGVSASAALGLMGAMAGNPAAGTSPAVAQGEVAAPAPPAPPAPSPSPVGPAPSGEVVVIVVEVDEAPPPTRNPARAPAGTVAPPASVSPPPTLAAPPVTAPAPRPTVVPTTAPPVTKSRAS